MFGPMEALWDGYRVVEEDVVVHPRRVWREHRAERVRDLRYKALLRVWAFDQLPAGLNSPDKSGSSPIGRCGRSGVSRTPAAGWRSMAAYCCPLGTTRKKY